MVIHPWSRYLGDSGGHLFKRLLFFLPTSYLPRHHGGLVSCWLVECSEEDVGIRNGQRCRRIRAGPGKLLSKFNQYDSVDSVPDTISSRSRSREE